MQSQHCISIADITAGANSKYAWTGQSQDNTISDRHTGSNFLRQNFYQQRPVTISESSSSQGLEACFIQFKCTRNSRDNWTLIHERMCSVSIGRYSEGASSNPAGVNVFQLTLAVSHYHEKFMFMYVQLLKQIFSNHAMKTTKHWLTEYR